MTIALLNTAILTASTQRMPACHWRPRSDHCCSFLSIPDNATLGQLELDLLLQITQRKTNEHEQTPTNTTLQELERNASELEDDGARMTKSEPS